MLDWSVTVERKGEKVLCIEPGHLSGRDLSQDDEEAIRTAARHLLAFIGDPPLPKGQREADENLEFWDKTKQRT